MATTKTTRLNLAKQEKGDAAWHTDLNQGFDDADDRLLQAGSGSPVINGVTPHYVGQLYHDTSPDTLWLAYGATSSDWRIIRGVAATLEASIQSLDEVEYGHVLGVATDTGALWAVISGTWTQLTRPSGADLYDFASSNKEQATTGSWADYELDAGGALTATVDIPATPTYAVWNIHAEGFIYLFDDQNDQFPAVRFKEAITVVGAGTTYPMKGATGRCGGTPVAVKLHTMVEGATLGATYTYTMQIGHKTAGSGAYANYHATVAGPDSDVDPEAYIWCRAWRVDV